MYYNYDQYLAYRKAKDAVDEFKQIQPREPAAVTFINPITNETAVFDGLTTIPEDQYELYRGWECTIEPLKYPIPYMPNFYEFVKHDVPQDVYKTRTFEIKAKNGTLELLTPSELHYLQTGEWNV